MFGVSVAVVGAGISGLVAARRLRKLGAEVFVFEKSRGLGGRMSTRRTEDGQQFDHGAQYFTVRDARFEEAVIEWRRRELVAQWPAKDCIVVLRNGQATPAPEQERFVGRPGMNAIAKFLAEGLDVSLSTRVAEIEAVGPGMRLSNETGITLGTFDKVIVSAPAPQASVLLQKFPRLSERLANIKMNPCWAVMVQTKDELPFDWQGAFVHESLLSWVARNGSKAGRPVGEALVLHAHADWTSEHWDDEPNQVCAQLLAEFWRVSGLKPQPLTHESAHRWRYALAAEPLDEGCLTDATHPVIACGDWAHGSRVEGAFLSGLAAADACVARTAARASGSGGRL